LIMILPERIATIVVCSFAALMLAVLVLYGCTFFPWSFTPALLARLDTVLEKTTWVNLLLCMATGIIIGLITHRFRWSLRTAPSWVQTLWAIAFVVAITLNVVLMLKGKPVAVRVQDQTVEISVDGKWQAVSASTFEQTIRRNARRHLAGILFGVVLWTGFAAAVSAYDPKQPLPVGQERPPVAPP